MSILKAATGGAYLKAGFLGFAGSGKTHTAIELALGTRRLFDLTGPLAMFDTESGSDYWRDRVRKETGQDLLVAKTRSLADLMETTREAAAAGTSVLIVDSITHVWREVTDQYRRQKVQRKKTDRLEFQDWARIKESWAQWPDWFLNSPMHVIVCGRAGYEYEIEKDDEGRKELIKSGIKMKVEGEFGFEPSLLVEMQRDFVTDKKGQLTENRTVINRAIVLKDRYGLIDGMMADDPTFEFFKPHVSRLHPSQHAPVDTSGKTEFNLDGDGRTEWDRERAHREIASEKIKAAIQMAQMDGQSADDKKRRAEAMQTFWGTTSWKELSENVSSSKLLSGLSAFEEAHGLASKV